jgi:predicted ATPase with chaperone activity
MVGPPGSGKTLLARTVPSILPPLRVSLRLSISGSVSVRL